MGFTGSLKLGPLDINPDSQQRLLYKNMMNSVIGKFSQKMNFAQTKYVSSSAEIDALFEADDKIVDFQTISRDICEIQLAPAEYGRHHMDSRKTNPIITAFVTSLSRIDMHKNIVLLANRKMCPLYTDTDSIIFSMPKGRTIPFELNGGLGFFKPEHQTPLNGFCCIGKKSYVVSTFAGESETKVCGLSFTSQAAKETLDFSDFESFLTKKKPPQKVRQTRTRIVSKPNISVTKDISEIQIPTHLNFSRSLKNNGNRTEPYGFTNVSHM